MKKLLFVINTLGYGGAERAMLSLFGALDPEEYEISLFVLTGQGELIHELPPYIKVLNKEYKDCSVLTEEGRKLLMKHCPAGQYGKNRLQTKKQSRHRWIIILLSYDLQRICHAG